MTAKNMAKTHTLARGETIVDIALQNGFRTWETIWEHAGNEELRKERPNPNVLAQGDKIYIPDKEVEYRECATNQRHIFRVKAIREYLQQTLLDENGDPMAGLDYELKAGDKTYRRKTSSTGLLREEVPVDAKTATLKLWMREGDDSSVVEWTINLGHLEPVDTTYGLKARLNNLGYSCGTVNDTFDDKTEEALRLFQQDYGLPVTGKNDEATSAKLLEQHDKQAESQG